MINESCIAGDKAARDDQWDSQHLRGPLRSGARSVVTTLVAQLSLSYPTLSYPTLSYPTLPHPALPLPHKLSVNGCLSIP